MTLAPDIIRLIDDKASSENGAASLRHASVYIRQLNEHISGTSVLVDQEIKAKVNFLASTLTITFDNPMQKLELLRARRCDEKMFTNVDELSYIKKSTKTLPEVGRLNKTGQALYYASVAVQQNEAALQAVLSEVKAKELDHFTVLRSDQVSGVDLNLRVIGIWDLVRRNEKPYYLSSDTFEYYIATRKYMVRQFSADLLLAYDLTDRFLADILSREGSKRLYQVTSALSSVFMDGNIDGVLYSSVKAKGEPVVALKPESVDSKLEHQFACHVIIEQCYGYEFYNYKTVQKTTNINSKTGNLEWQNMAS